MYRHWRTGAILDYDTHRAVTDPLHATARFHRAHLHAALLEHVPLDTIHLGKKTVRVEVGGDNVSGGGGGGVVLHFADSSSAGADLCIGADGLRSNVRKWFVPNHKLHWTGWVAMRFTFAATLPYHHRPCSGSHVSRSIYGNALLPYKLLPSANPAAASMLLSSVYTVLGVVVVSEFAWGCVCVRVCVCVVAACERTRTRNKSAVMRRNLRPTLCANAHTGPNVVNTPLISANRSRYNAACCVGPCSAHADSCTIAEKTSANTKKDVYLCTAAGVAARAARSTSCHDAVTAVRACVWRGVATGGRWRSRIMSKAEGLWMPGRCARNAGRWPCNE